MGTHFAGCRMTEVPRAAPATGQWLGLSEITACEGLSGHPRAHPGDRGTPLIATRAHKERGDLKEMLCGMKALSSGPGRICAALTIPRVSSLRQQATPFPSSTLRMLSSTGKGRYWGQFLF